MSAQLNLQNGTAPTSTTAEKDQYNENISKLPPEKRGLLIAKTASRWRSTASIVSGQPEITRADCRISSLVFDPDSALLFYWLGAVSIATVYNTWMIALRIAFPEVRQEPVPQYLEYLDGFCDCIYIVDILIHLRTAYMLDGIPVFDPGEIRKHYTSQTDFIRDIIAVIPSETILLYFVPDFFGLNESLLNLGAARLTRLFKIHILYRFHDLAESRTSVPHFIRVFRLCMLLAVFIHWIACFYYLLSEYEGLGSNDWVYTSAPEEQRFVRKYIVCMYWSAMTLTTIGNTDGPETDLEYMFTGVIFLTGVFVFATVLGNVGDVISSMNASREEFEERMDHIKMYLTHKKVPASLQLKIKKWAEYSWSRTKAIDEYRLLNILPERLRAEVAVHVHLDNLKKVKIFEKCETGFLCELVLKLRPQVFSPGDYICKVGETGREMFIINHGKVEVAVPNPSTNEETVVAILCEGDYFGEISLLRLDGSQNRRTADVRSIGYSELLCLSRKDLMAALVEYPEAKSALEAQAKLRMKTSMQAKRAFSVDALLRSSQDQSSLDGGTNGTSLNREDSKGREVSEIKAMIEELKNVNKIPSRTLWQLIARCELLQAKIHEKENEVKESKEKILELERMLSRNRFQCKTSQHVRHHFRTITKQLSQAEGHETIYNTPVAVTRRSVYYCGSDNTTCDNAFVNGSKPILGKDILREQARDKFYSSDESLPLDNNHRNGTTVRNKTDELRSNTYRKPPQLHRQKTISSQDNKLKNGTNVYSHKASPTLLLDETELPTLNSCAIVKAVENKTLVPPSLDNDDESPFDENSSTENLLSDYLKKKNDWIDPNQEEMIVKTLEGGSDYEACLNKYVDRTHSVEPNQDKVHCKRSGLRKMHSEKSHGSSSSDSDSSNSSQDSN